MSSPFDLEKWVGRIEDILAAIDRIEAFLDRRSEAVFIKDEILVSAVTYQLFIIGEASTHLPPDIAERHPSVPWKEMRGMRNVIAHEYGSVDARIVWQVATTNLAPLRLALLAERDWLTSC